MKEELRSEIAKMKEELRQEIKSSREAVERALRNEIRDLKNEQIELIKSVEHAHGTIDELKAKLDAEIAKNEVMATENEALRAGKSTLERRTDELDKRIVRQEQYSRNSNLEIQGVEIREGESVENIVSEIGRLIEEPISSSDLEACHRVPTRKPDKSNIVVQFKSRAKRDIVLKKAKKHRLANNDIGLGTQTPIYVNEHLCPALKKLLGMAVQRKREHDWKFVWSVNGKILAKQTEDSNSIHITCEKDLAKIC